MNFNKVHLVGAGGIGMSGLKVWLEGAGFQITCSDDAACNPSFIPENSTDFSADRLIISSAIKPSHPQYRYASEARIPIVHRSQATKELMHGTTISVTGSHGKSTTSGMIAFILQKYYPTSFLIGGVLRNLGCSAMYNSSEQAFCVVEADESDNSMNTLVGDYHLITNISEEHIDYYGNFDTFKSEMQRFCDASKVTVVHYSCKDQISGNNTVFYGQGSDFYATNLRINQSGTIFDLVTPNSVWKDVFIRLHGTHMVENCIGCARMLLQLGLNEEQIRNGLSEFLGIKRRMEEFLYNDKIIIQDYANHPNDIKCVLETVKQIYPDRHIHVIWEPHRYSRIGYKDNLDRIIDCFGEVASSVLLMPVWKAGEVEPEHLTYERLQAKINFHLPCSKMNNNHDLNEYLDQIDKNEVVVAFGSGGIYKMVNSIIVNSY